MPAEPSWIQRLPDLITQVSDPDAPSWWDRSAIETLFRLRRRQAIKVLQMLGAQRIGTNLAVDRAMLLRFLQDPRQHKAYSNERARSRHVAISLTKAQQDLQGRTITIPAPPDTRQVDFAGLPTGIHLQQHQLTITFGPPTELLEKLFALSQALMNDYDHFEEALQQKNV